MISFDPSQREASGERGTVVLRRPECVVLDRLLKANGRFVTYDTLADDLWPDADAMPDGWTRAINVHVCWLRRRLSQIADVRIENRYALGYAMKGA